MRYGIWILAGGLALAGLAFAGKKEAPKASPAKAVADKAALGGKMDKMVKTEAQWKEELPYETFCIMRQSGTESPFHNKYWDHHEDGVYRCAACGEVLFKSDAKFDSGTGWPSYFQPAAKGVIDEHRDVSHGMIRTEVTCHRCGGHLGHLFPDGPPPTGTRYCINSAALKFEPAAPKK